MFAGAYLGGNLRVLSQSYPRAPSCRPNGAGAFFCGHDPSIEVVGSNVYRAAAGTDAGLGQASDKGSDRFARDERFCPRFACVENAVCDQLIDFGVTKSDVALGILDRAEVGNVFHGLSRAWL